MYFPIQNFFIIADDQKFVKFDFFFSIACQFLGFYGSIKIMELGLCKWATKRRAKIDVYIDIAAA